MSLFLSTLSLRRATHSRRSRKQRHPHFYPRSPCGERRKIKDFVYLYNFFLSTLSLRRATSASYNAYLAEGFSIHALLAESDRALRQLQSALRRIFYPRSPCGERLKVVEPGFANKLIFYPRSPCGERLREQFKYVVQCRFSIHALLAESDAAWNRFTQRRDFFSIHALLAESDQSQAVSHRTARNFLSTLSLRRATFREQFKYVVQCRFSIHALLAESDGRLGFLIFPNSIFLSTLSLRRATVFWFFVALKAPEFSIHALLAESDLPASAFIEAEAFFLSTLSLRRATGS